MNKILIGLVVIMIAMMVGLLNERNDLYKKNSQCMEVVEMYYEWSQK